MLHLCQEHEDHLVQLRWCKGHSCLESTSQIAKFMWPTWGPPGSCWPTWGPSGANRTQVGPMLAPWTLLSGDLLQHGRDHSVYVSRQWEMVLHCNAISYWLAAYTMIQHSRFKLIHSSELNDFQLGLIHWHWYWNNYWISFMSPFHNCWYGDLY